MRPGAESTVDFTDLRARAVEFADRLAAVKAATEPPAVGWYPPMLPGHVDTLELLLTGDRRALLDPGATGPVADIGAADGDFGFFLDSLGFDIDLYDGADRPARLKEALGARAGLGHVHLDHDFELPRRYELVYLLHVLYHLRNPMLALETLAQFSRQCILSTRIADYATPRRRVRRRPSLRAQPLAYLLDPYELSRTDAASYWIFTEAGLLRLLPRCGWEVVHHMVVGDRTAAATELHQPRMWCLLRSRTA